MRFICFSIILIALATLAVAQPTTHGKVLIVVTSADYRPGKPGDHSWGCYTPEVTNFFGRVYQAGYTAADIDIASLTGGKTPLAVKPTWPGKYHLPLSEKQAIEHKLDHALAPGSIHPADYDAIYYSGGFSCLVDFPTASAIAGIASAIYLHGGVVAAVCDGAAGLLPIKLKDGTYLVAGRNIAVNSNDRSLRTQLQANGAILSKEKLVVDSRLITARGVRPAKVANALLTAL